MSRIFSYKYFSSKNLFIFYNYPYEKITLGIFSYTSTIVLSKLNHTEIKLLTFHWQTQFILPLHYRSPHLWGYLFFKSLRLFLSFNEFSIWFLIVFWAKWFVRLFVLIFYYEIFLFIAMRLYSYFKFNIYSWNKYSSNAD